MRDEAAVSTDDAFAVDDRVGAIFPYVAASGAFMALWVFGPFPGSAYTGAIAKVERLIAVAQERLAVEVGGAVAAADGAYRAALDALYIASYITTFAYFGAAEWAARGEWREDEERTKRDRKVTNER